jgi:hypothetical protein
MGLADGKPFPPEVPAMVDAILVLAGIVVLLGVISDRDD